MELMLYGIKKVNLIRKRNLKCLNVIKSQRYKIIYIWWLRMEEFKIIKQHIRNFYLTLIKYLIILIHPHKNFNFY